MTLSELAMIFKNCKIEMNVLKKFWNINFIQTNRKKNFKFFLSDIFRNYL